MQVDIYIRELNGKRELRIPWLPEAINCQSGELIVASYDIINKGEVAVPTGTGLSSYSWSSEFPGKYREGEGMLRGDWYPPEQYHNVLEDWMKNGTPLNLLVTGYPINKDVILKEYQQSAAGAFGDIAYEVTFIEYREITVSTTVVTTTSTSASASASTTAQKRSTTTTQTGGYTVKKGDTLWTIAKSQLGDGAKWQLIYEANKTIIEKTAKQYGKSSSNNGQWIYPGTTLTIPREAESTTTTQKTSAGRSER